LILQHLFEGLKTPALPAFVGRAARFTARPLTCAKINPIFRLMVKAEQSGLLAVYFFQIPPQISIYGAFR